MVSIVNVYDIWRGRYTQKKHKDIREVAGFGMGWDGIVWFTWFKIRRNGMGIGGIYHVSINDHELELYCIYIYSWMMRVIGYVGS
jgi:hypothetical protein